MRVWRVEETLLLAVECLTKVVQLDGGGGSHSAQLQRELIRTLPFRHAPLGQPHLTRSLFISEVG